MERERHVLSQIACGVPLGQVLEELLQAVEARSARRTLASVLILSEDGKHLRHGAAPSLPAAYNDAIDGIAIGEGIGSCGTAARRAAPVYASDIDTDPLWRDFRELALGHQLRACWSTPILAATGRVLGTFAIYYDEPRTPTDADIEAIESVTQTAALAIERHLSDRALHRTEAELRRLNDILSGQVTARTQERDRAWQLSQDLLVTAGPDGVLESVNARWTELLGWEPEELIGSTFMELTHPDDLEATQAAFVGIFEAPLTKPFEYRLRGKNGQYSWFGWTGAFEDGRVYATGRDVTAEKEQAAALEQAQDALRQSQKMEAVGQLTGGLAHDFNNLLTGIMGNLELLQARVAAGRFDGIDRFVNAAQGAGRRAAALTHRLLAFSRRQTLDPKPTDVNRLIASMEELIRRSVGPAVDIEVVGAAGLWPALIDPGQLENALLNLAINARDAMPDGGRLTIETANKWLDDRAGRERDLAPGQYLSICVTDTGTGMTPEVISRAFDPFYTTKPLGEGTGLGLSMIYGFARQSGGQIRIYSEVGQGTTMCIYLPRHVGDEPEGAGEIEGAVALDMGKGETILVVDDEPTIRHLIDEVLDELGYTVIGAADGAAGLKVLQSGARIELLITDVGLPGGMNGRQVADAARSLRPGLKVLFITGYAENAAIGHGHLGAGMELLTKPFTLDDLGRRVRDLIAKRV